MRRGCGLWRYLLPAVGVACSFAAVAPTYAQQEQEGYGEVITVGERIFGLGWDSGSSELYVENARKQKKLIRITYRGERNERMNALVIRTDTWRVDLSQYVRDLSYPFPSRILITVDGVKESQGPLPRMTLSLPYAVIIPERINEPRCCSM